MLWQIIFWIIFMYGFLSLIQDIITEFTYKRFNKNIKVYICINDFENEFENFERELFRIKWLYKNINITVVNCDKSVSEDVVKNFFDGSNVNVYSRDELANIIK